MGDIEKKERLSVCLSFISQKRTLLLSFQEEDTDTLRSFPTSVADGMSSQLKKFPKADC